MAHFLQTQAEPHLVYSPYIYHALPRLISLQYYKPWETSPDEEERIQEQIAEAKDLIKREVEEYEARQQQDSQRERHKPEEAGRDARGSETGKSHNADAPQDTPTTNGETNGSATSPQDLDMKDDHHNKPGTEATRDGNGSATADVQDSNMSSHETIADEPSKVNDDDENGEDVVEEAAEDTVIY
jgi:hypothetical protein